MDGPTGQPQRRTLTPAILASALFVAASAVFAVTFVAGRGGLEMPVASRAPVAVASPTSPARSAEATAAPTSAPPTAAASEAPPSATVQPTPAPPTDTPPTDAPPTLDPDDPLLALPECPDRPGCFIYVIQRFDTLSGIVSRYLLSTVVVLALNPEISDPGLIVTGQVLYLGRDPFARLEPCPDEPDCSIYEVIPGDSLARIASRYGLAQRQIRRQNPDMATPLFVGQVLELPHPA